MGLVSRIVTFVTGTSASAVEVNGEFDNILSTLNGNIDNANISASAAIAATKVAEIPPARVLDHADSETEYKTTTSPGDTGTPDLPSTLEGELERMRYRMGNNRGYSTGTYYMDASGVLTATTASWTEPRIVGPNLLPNPGFEIHTLGTPNPPDGWSDLSQAATVAIEAAFGTAQSGVGLYKRSLRFLTDGNSQGISATIGGLKPSQKYLVGMRYTRTAGTINLITSGGLAAGDYQNLALSDATGGGTTVEVLQGVVMSTSVPGAMTVSIYGTATGADFNLIDVWMYELADGVPNEIPAIAMQTAVYDTADDTLTNAGAGAWSTRTDLSLSQYVPFQGYRLTYETTICFRGEQLGSATDENYEYAFRIQLDGSTVEGPYAFRQALTQQDEFHGGLITLKHVVENPTPGSTYDFTVDVYTQGSGNAVSNIIFNPTTATALATQSQARLVVERI